MNEEIIAIVGVGLALGGVIYTSITRLDNRLDTRISAVESLIGKLREQIEIHLDKPVDKLEAAADNHDFPGGDYSEIDLSGQSGAAQFTKPGGSMQSSYQTKPLTEYEPDFQQRAEELFNRVQERIGRARRQTWRYKGSYSIFGLTSPQTAVKIIIFEANRGHGSGTPLLHQDGVYVLIRANGTLGDQMRGDQIWERASNGTIGIAPHHSEHFGYFRLSEQDDANEIADSIERCVQATR